MQMPTTTITSNGRLVMAQLVSCAKHGSMGRIHADLKHFWLLINIFAPIFTNMLRISFVFCILFSPIYVYTTCELSELSHLHTYPFQTANFFTYNLPNFSADLQIRRTLTLSVQFSKNYGTLILLVQFSTK